MYIGLHVKYPLLLSDCNETWKFLDRFSKNIHILNFMEILPVESEVFREDRQTRHDGVNKSLFAILRTRLKTESQSVLSCMPRDQAELQSQLIIRILT